MDQDFVWFRDHHAENMERMFAAVGDLYAEQWGDFFHFAIYEDPAEDRDAAFAHTHRRYADALRVAEAAKVLELACGRGGFTDFLAANTQGDVLGIDISRAQLSHAMRHRRPNLRFRHHDIMRVDELGETFDAVAFMDADCYLPDKGAALGSIARVMASGARFLLIAWCKRDGLSGLQEELVLHPFMRFWGVPGLETPTAYRRHFQQAGLRLVEEQDLNDKVRPNWDFGYQQAIEGVRTVSMARAAQLLWKGLPLGAEGIRLIKEQFHAALYIKAAFDAGLLRYTYFLAEKP
ncbi:SAM-dependent methyltransferase [Azospirillum soli]|uniref:SAM-dependent methyltransferase n=1 Tax=Azospirillum soli TaxID=1304799 RepID=UPI001AE4D3F3|nr:class I SAM-dependent methyltransferase [Azospirillum soli]MBP2312564.1 SAM-dependent methyltransferase [Azospirillum soli]